MVRDLAGPQAPASSGRSLRPGRSGSNTTICGSATSAWRRPRASFRSFRHRSSASFRPTAARLRSAKIGEDLHAHWEPSASDYHLRGTTDAGYVPDADVEIGARVWYSSGRFQKDLGATVDPTQSSNLISRLTYNTTAATGEVFGRVDSPSNIFLKGFLDGGAITSGNLHDEDWAAPIVPGQIVPYSNTVSTVNGDLAYGTIDAGYSVFRGPSTNVGGFIGFNYYRENKRAYGLYEAS